MLAELCPPQNDACGPDTGVNEGWHVVIVADIPSFIAALHDILQDIIPKVDRPAGSSASRCERVLLDGRKPMW